MRIVHVANITNEVPVKKTKKEARYERCMLMLKNQRFEDKKRAQKMFEVRLENIRIKLQLLKL